MLAKEEVVEIESVTEVGDNEDSQQHIVEAAETSDVDPEEDRSQYQRRISGCIR